MTSPAPVSEASIATSSRAQRVVARPPLGLPSGSVRALLTLIVVGFIVTQTVRGVGMSLLWTETLLIVLAHYFTSRRFVPLSPKLLAELEAEGKLERESTPLYLPRWTVRGLIVLAFVGLAVYLAWDGRLLAGQTVEILGTVGAYFLGMGFSATLGWWRRRRGLAPPNWWGDVKAIAAVGFMGMTVALRLTDATSFLPFAPTVLEDVTLGVVLFYFGSR